MTRDAIDTLVFDLGGVFIDWNPRYMYRKLFEDEAEMEDFLETICTSEWNRELDRGCSFAEAVSELRSRHPEFAAEIEAYDSRWEEMLGGRIEDAVRALEELHERGYALYALTNWSAEKFPVARSRYEFLGLFEEILVSGEEGLVKPDREIYELLARRTGINPARSVFVDDREENVRAAEKLGFTGVVFRDPRQMRRDLAGLDLLPDGKARP